MEGSRFGGKEQDLVIRIRVQDQNWSNSKSDLMLSE